MNWTNEIVIGETLLVLKTDDEKIGYAGEIFFASDYSIDLTDDTLKTILTSPTFNGNKIEEGFTSLIITDEQLMDKFTPLDKTLQQLKKETQLENQQKGI